MNLLNYDSERGSGYSHRVVEVSHHPRTLARGGITEAGVVGITDDALYPGQSTCRGHGLVGEMALNRRKTACCSYS